jgi:hypothetical protein
VLRCGGASGPHEQRTALPPGEIYFCGDVDPADKTSLICPPIFLAVGRCSHPLDKDETSKNPANQGGSEFFDAISPSGPRKRKSFLR